MAKADEMSARKSRNRIAPVKRFPCGKGIKKSEAGDFVTFALPPDLKEE